MEFKIIEDTLLPRHIRYGITNSIGLLHRFEKQVSLFVSRQKFYFQCQLHTANIQIISDIRKLFNFGNAKAGAFLPSALRDQWVSCAKIL